MALVNQLQNNAMRQSRWQLNRVHQQTDRRAMVDAAIPSMPPAALSHYDERLEQREADVKSQDLRPLSKKNVRGYHIEGKVPRSGRTILDPMMSR